MTDPTNSGTPGGAPGAVPRGIPGGNAAGGSPTGNTAGNAGAQEFNFVRSRANQMAQSQQPTDGAQPDSGAQQQHQRQQSPQEAMARFADGSEYKESDLLAALGERAEAQSRKATLPSSADGYEIKLPDGRVRKIFAHFGHRR
jgi:hypothetical protein